MANTNALSTNLYIGTYYFRVTITGFVDPLDGFLKISPVTAKTETVEFKHGTDKNVRHVAGRTTYHPVVLERVYQGTDEFRGWRDQVEGGQILRRDVTIQYCSPDGEPVRTLILGQAYPIEWEMPGMDSSSSAPAVEKITLAVESVANSGGGKYKEPTA